ncbi:MAG: prkC 6 [Fibrobacteres bacterium]|nr:prkC 6 [Fibrobacterota bacterium]
MQCRECGASIASNVAFCPNCGVRQSLAAPVPQNAKEPVQSSPLPVSAPGPAPRPQAKPLVSQEAAGKADQGRGTPPSKPARAALPQAGETFANRYRVEKYLGLGALCNSYLCRDLGAGSQEVVLKVMHARKAAEPGLAESFLFLAESVAKYDHRGIARIYDSGIHEGAPYYTMEWVGGIPLRLWLMERLNFENRVLPGLGIISSLLDTFETIHERGCYGCLKPENVFITLNGPVITDFGVVGFLSPQEFEFNSYARRYLPYMAPELRQDWGNLLPHSDYFSLGAILYEILVGRAPAPQLRLPSELSRIFDIEADEIILKSMAPKPLDRFGTVEAFKNAVVSLQTSLLHARPQEAIPGLPPSVNATIAPRGEATPGVTSDVQKLHNPEESFAVPDASRGFAGGMAPGHDGPAHKVGPWTRERPTEGVQNPVGAVSGGEEGEDEDPAARTVFYPKTGMDEAEKPFSAIAGMGDRVVEEAHAQRRFAHPQAGPPAAIQPVEGASPNAFVHGLDWESQADQPIGGEGEVPEEESEPIPAWLWISIALAGSSMVVLSAYFGLLHSN